MQSRADTNQRVQELVAKIETEQDPGRFSALAEELSRLLDLDEDRPGSRRAADSSPG
jgi:hypothetical protein